MRGEILFSAPCRAILSRILVFQPGVGVEKLYQSGGLAPFERFEPRIDVPSGQGLEDQASPHLRRETLDLGLGQSRVSLSTGKSVSSTFRNRRAVASTSRRQ